MMDTPFAAIGDRELRLFDLEADPHEQRDLAAALPEERERLREALHAWVAGGI